jgi:nitrate/nitrite transporter NarK
MSTLAFTVCFAVWTIFSIIGVRIKQELGLSETQFGLLIGMPILTGSLVRVLLGIWTDRFGGRLVYTATMPAAPLLSALLMSRASIRRASRAQHSVSSASAMSARRLPNSSRRSCCWPVDGRTSR